MRVKGGGKELEWPKDAQLRHSVHFPTSLVTWSAKLCLSFRSQPPVALVVASCCLGKQSWQEMMLAWTWAGVGVGGITEALSHYVLRLAPACWVSDRPGGSPVWQVRGPLYPGKREAPSTRKYKERVTTRKEIQAVGCSQLCLLDKFLSSCHFYENTWERWVEVRGRGNWLTASFTGFRNTCSSWMCFCAPSTVSGRDGGNGWVWMLSSHDVQICLLLKEIGHLFLLGPVLLGTVKCIQIRFCGRVFFTAVLLGWVTCNCLFFRFPLTAYTSVSPTLQRFGLFCLVW